MVFFKYAILSFLPLLGWLKEEIHSWMEPSSKIFFSSDSKMYLIGNTNVGIYSCDCFLPQEYIPLCYNYKNSKLIFQDIRMAIATNTIDCHKELYNHNIKKGLDVENFPFIDIDLMEAWKSDQSMFMNEKEWFDVVGKVNLKIKETQKVNEVAAKGWRISKNKYRIIGSHILSMKDFDIVVPTIFFGFIKVEDKIVFNFDLKFEIIE